MKTLTEVLALADVTVPDELIADVEVPALSGPQRQGDVLIVPRKPLTAAERKMASSIPQKGVSVVRGEATGNAHILHADGSCVWSAREAGLLLGVVEVGDGATAFLIHTDEHGANAMAPGTYELHGKREQADEIRRVAD